MKCLYFLQTVRRVPLRYHFGLYTYGPFDSDVLIDLSLGTVKVGSVRLSIDAPRRASLYRLRRRMSTPPGRIAWVEKRRSGTDRRNECRSGT
jgi:hypothetical protein